MRLNYGGIPPAWDDDTLAVAHMKYGKVTVFDESILLDKIKKGFDEPANRQNRNSRNLVVALTTRNEERWKTSLGDVGNYEPLSVAIAPNAVMAVARYQDLRRASPQFCVTAHDSKDGKQMFQTSLPSEPLPGSLIVNRNGHIIVTLLDGSVVCYGE